MVLRAAGLGHSAISDDDEDDVYELKVVSYALDQIILRKRFFSIWSQHVANFANYRDNSTDLFVIVFFQAMRAGEAYDYFFEVDGERLYDFNCESDDVEVRETPRSMIGSASASVG